MNKQLPAMLTAKQRQRRRNDFEAACGCRASSAGASEPVHECRGSAGIAVLDTAAEQPRAQTVDHSDVRPFSVVEPPVRLETAEIEKRHETSIADHRADHAQNPQACFAGVHVEAPRVDVQLLTSSARCAGFTSANRGIQ